MKKKSNQNIKEVRYHFFIRYLMSHLGALFNSFGKLFHNPLSTLTTLTVITVALALPTGLFVLLENLHFVAQGWNDNAQISVYLKTDLSSSDTQNLIEKIKNQSGVMNVNYVSPAEGLEEFQKQTGLQNALSVLDKNPLPGVILVRPNENLQTPTGMNTLVQQLKSFSGVDLVEVDLAWVQRLYAILDLGKRVIFALGCLLAFGVLFIVGNTIHSSFQNYQKEIEIFKLIGATNAFIRRPFLYTGMLYGLGGSLMAWMLVTCILWSLSSPVNHLASLYNSHFQLQGVHFSMGINLLLSGLLLGWVGAWLAVSRNQK